MLRVITLNINGIRSGARKGFFDWLARQDADVVCLQETKAQMQVLTDALFRPAGYHCYFADAEKKGYSGVGVFSRRLPSAVHSGLGFPCADQEGRYLQLDFSDQLSVASLYLPSGSAKEERQTVKFDFMHYYERKLAQQIAGSVPMIICGDWNIVHKERDIKNFKSNQKNSGCLPQERAWLDYVFDELGWVDAFRQVNQQSDQYTWWSNRGRAYENNVGWRIDYQIVHHQLKSKVRAAQIYKEERFSDHAPLVIDYDWDISQ